MCKFVIVAHFFLACVSSFAETDRATLEVENARAERDLIFIQTQLNQNLLDADGRKEFETRLAEIKARLERNNADLTAIIRDETERKAKKAKLDAAHAARDFARIHPPEQAAGQEVPDFDAAVERARAEIKAHEPSAAPVASHKIRDTQPTNLDIRSQVRSSSPAYVKPNTIAVGVGRPTPDFYTILFSLGAIGCTVLTFRPLKKISDTRRKELALKDDSDARLHFHLFFPAEAVVLGLMAASQFGEDSESLRPVVVIFGLIMLLILVAMHVKYYKKNVALPATQREAQHWVLMEYANAYSTAKSQGGAAMAVLGAIGNDPFLFAHGRSTQCEEQLALLQTQRLVPGPQSGALIRAALRSGEIDVGLQPVSFINMVFPARVFDAVIEGNRCKGNITVDGRRFGPFTYDVEFDEQIGYWCVD